MRKVREAKYLPNSSTVSAGLAASVVAVKELLTEVGRSRSIRDPIADISGDLTPAQLHTILWLGKDGALTPGVLAQRVGCAQPSLTGVIDRLERDGYVERSRDTEDRRKVHVELTEQGRALYRQLDESVDLHLGALLALLGDADRRALERILSHIVDAMRSRQNGIDS